MRTLEYRTNATIMVALTAHGAGKHPCSVAHPRCPSCKELNSLKHTRILCYSFVCFQKHPLSPASFVGTCQMQGSSQCAKEVRNSQDCIGVALGFTFPGT